MIATETVRGTELTDEIVRNQLSVLVEDHAFRSSRRSVAFLQYVVEQTLQGAAEVLKERMIGVEVFGRDPLYDTSEDHVVRTAATELRKRLAIYYGEQEHRFELRITLQPGSYVPRFALPSAEPKPPAAELPPIEPDAPPKRRWKMYIGIGPVLLAAVILAASSLHQKTPRAEFWSPILHSSGPVLVAAGYVPDGPPTISAKDAADDAPPSLRPG